MDIYFISSDDLPLNVELFLDESNTWANFFSSYQDAFSSINLNEAVLDNVALYKASLNDTQIPILLGCVVTKNHAKILVCPIEKIALKRSRS